MEHLLPRTVAHRPGLVARIRAALVLRRQRHRLPDFGDHLLDDIGITREMAEREASQAIWDVPHGWRS